MKLEEFIMENPWATDVAKSSILLAMLRYLKQPRTTEEVAGEFAELSDDDIAKALYVFKELGVVEGSKGKIWLSDKGMQFLKVYDEAF